MTKKEKPKFKVVLVWPTMKYESIRGLEKILASGFILNDKVRVTDDCVLLIFRKG